MATSRSKRWNGKKEALTTTYLKDVMQHMVTYGDRMQFGQSAIDQRPAYRIINGDGKKIAFDGNHHLLHADDEEFSDAAISAILTIEQLRAAIAAGGFKRIRDLRPAPSSGSGTRTPRVTTTAKARANELIDTEKYQYFKANASTMPEGIRSYSNEISDLMRTGMTAEEAFNDVIKRHF